MNQEKYIEIEAKSKGEQLAERFIQGSKNRKLQDQAKKTQHTGRYLDFTGKKIKVEKKQQKFSKKEWKALKKKLEPEPKKTSTLKKHLDKNLKRFSKSLRKIPTGQTSFSKGIRKISENIMTKTKKHPPVRLRRSLTPSQKLRRLKYLRDQRFADWKRRLAEIQQRRRLQQPQQTPIRPFEQRSIPQSKIPESVREGDIFLDTDLMSGKPTFRRRLSGRSAERWLK